MSWAYWAPKSTTRTGLVMSRAYPVGTTPTGHHGPMKTYVALLRGINLGRTRKVAMADLRTWLEELGYGSVRTLLQSGNALFTSDRKPAELEREIGKRLEEQTGFEVRCLIRDHAELRRVLDGDPFGDLVTNPSRYAVAFLSAEPTAARLAKLDPDA